MLEILSENLQAPSIEWDKDIKKQLKESLQNTIDNNNAEKKQKKIFKIVSWVQYYTDINASNHCRSTYCSQKHPPKKNDQRHRFWPAHFFETFLRCFHSENTAILKIKDFILMFWLTYHNLKLITYMLYLFTMFSICYAFFSNQVKASIIECTRYELYLVNAA